MRYRIACAALIGAVFVVDAAIAAPTVDVGAGPVLLHVADSTRVAVEGRARAALAEAGVGVSLRGAARIVPPVGRDPVVGIWADVGLGAAYAWPRLSVALDGGIAGYQLTACRAPLCGVVAGIAPGATLLATWRPPQWERLWVHVGGSAWALLGDASIVRGSWTVAATVGLNYRF